MGATRRRKEIGTRRQAHAGSENGDGDERISSLCIVSGAFAAAAARYKYMYLYAYKVVRRQATEAIVCL